MWVLVQSRLPSLPARDMIPGKSAAWETLAAARWGTVPDAGMWSDPACCEQGLKVT